MPLPVLAGMRQKARSALVKRDEPVLAVDAGWAGVEEGRFAQHRREFLEYAVDPACAKLERFPVRPPGNAVILVYCAAQRLVRDDLPLLARKPPELALAVVDRAVVVH